MNFIQEYGLLVAVAAPVVVVLAMQVFLFVAGERGTLLFPNLRPFDRVDMGPQAEPVETAQVPAHEPANIEYHEHMERKAA